MIRIKRITRIGVRLPLTQPMKRSKGEMKTSDNVLVRIEAGDVVGWGEAGSAPTMTGELMVGMVEAVSYLAPFLEGVELEDIGEAHALMEHNLYGNHGAKAAIEMALYDALGKSLGKPVHALFGEQRRDRIPALRYLASGDLETDVADAARLTREGYVAYKIKMGAASVAQDIERTRRVCDVVDPRAMVSSDVNRGWTVDQALRYVNAVADTRLAFLEQPVPPTISPAWRRSPRRAVSKSAATKACAPPGISPCIKRPARRTAPASRSASLAVSRPSTTRRSSPSVSG